MLSLKIFYFNIIYENGLGTSFNIIIESLLPIKTTIKTTKASRSDGNIFIYNYMLKYIGGYLYYMTRMVTMMKVGKGEEGMKWERWKNWGGWLTTWRSIAIITA